MWVSRRCGFHPWVRKIPWRRKWQTTPVFLPAKSHGQRSFMGFSPWGRKELARQDFVTEQQQQIVDLQYSVSFRGMTK